MATLLEIVVEEQVHVCDSLRVVSKLQVISMENSVVNLDLDASIELEGMGSNYVFP
jgi:hypothetical protein